MAKRTMEMCILCDGEKSQSLSGIKTDEKRRKWLASMPNRNDAVGMEACAYAFLLARFLQSRVGCTIYILNSGKLRMIWKSTRKTDKEDARKTGSFIQRNPEEELPLACLPSEKEEELRDLVSTKHFLTKTRTSLINRLHALYVHAGFTGLKKSNLASKEKRAGQKSNLANTHLLIADSIEQELTVAEEQLVIFEEKIKEIIRESELAPYIMSIPGADPGLASAFLAYVGAGSRFSKASEVADYVELVPRLDCSGETNHYGNITKSGCRALRSIILQGAWSLARSKDGGRLQAKYLSLSSRMSKTKSAVAIARRMVTLMWVLVRRRESYADITREQLQRKFRYHKLNLKGWEALAS